jgi:hypothetical protein
MFALCATEFPCHHDVITSFYLQSLSLHEAFSDLLMRLLKDAPECLAGYSHLLCSLILIRPFKIGEPDRLELIEAQNDFFQKSQRDPSRFEECRTGIESYASA